MKKEDLDNLFLLLMESAEQMKEGERCAYHSVTAEVYKYQFCHVCCVCFLHRSNITGDRIHDSDQECEGCLSILQISEVVSMAVVKIGDSVLVRLAHQRVSVMLAE